MYALALSIDHHLGLFSGSIESRSRSELIREAARGYIDPKRGWKQIFDFGKMNAAKKGIAKVDIETEISAFRREKKK